jgi:hypothetical protein
MVQSEVLCRVLHLKFDNKTGTTFSLEKDSIQYLVTAKHIFEDLLYPSKATIELLLDDGYIKKEVSIFYHDIKGVDIAVMRIDPFEFVTPLYNNPNTTENIGFGQDTYFLGFPYDYNVNLTKFPNKKAPVPFIKKACLSNMMELADGSKWLLLDGINNEGFSGGPVCFKPSGAKSMSICGVVCHYIRTMNQVKQNVNSAEVELPFYTWNNTGIMFACNIIHVIEIIDKLSCH